MIAASVYSLALGLFCLLAFFSFSWAVKAHFIDPEERPLGMRIILIASPAGILATLVTYHFVAVGSASFLLALLLYTLSLMVFWWAIRATHASQRMTFAFAEDRPSFLATSGPYRLVRHPFYSSYLLFWLAGAVGTWAWWLFVLFGAMAYLYWNAAKAEERKFGDSALSEDYAAYAARTGMFLPWVFSR